MTISVKDPRKIDPTIPTRDSINRLEEVVKRKKTQDIINSFRKLFKEGIYFGEREAPLPGDEKEKVVTELKSKKDDVDKKDKDKEEDEDTDIDFSSDSTDPTNNAMKNIEMMSKLTDNEFAQGGAALLGIMQAEQARKEANRKLEGDKGDVAFEGKSKKAEIYQKLATSLKGMLS